MNALSKYMVGCEARLPDYVAAFTVMNLSIPYSKLARCIYADDSPQFCRAECSVVGEGSCHHLQRCLVIVLF